LSEVLALPTEPSVGKSVSTITVTC
jgi:hypothetical protein